MKRLFKLLHDGWVIAGVTLLLILVLDAALQKWLPEHAQWSQIKPGTTTPDKRDAPFFQQSNWADQYFDEHKHAKANHWRSYVYWRRDPYAGELIQIDDSGMRAGWEPDQPADYQIWMFGGSTVWGTGARTEQTLPSSLAKLLAQAGVSAQVLNFGESGYVSTQSLNLLLQTLEEREQPDLVIFYEGANDVFSALQSGRAGLPQNEQHRVQEFRVTDSFGRYLKAFPNLLQGVRRLAAGSTQASELDAVSLGKSVAAHFERQVNIAKSVGDELGFEVLGYWQPTVFSKSTLSDWEQQIIDSSLEAHRAIQQAADKEIAVRSYHSEHIGNLSQSLNTQAGAIYMDFCHISEFGNEAVAQAMLNQVKPLLEGLSNDL